jgi:hypothetical protein
LSRILKRSVRYIDKAGTQDDGAFTAGVRWRRPVERKKEMNFTTMRARWRNMSLNRGP